MKTAEEQKGPRAARAGLAKWRVRRYTSLTSKFFPGPLNSAAEGIPGSQVFSHEINKQLATSS